MNNIMIPLEDQSPQDLHFISEAFIMAEEALTAKEIPVGCVFVKDGKIIAKGRNRTNEGRNGTMHAEFDALRFLLGDRSFPLEMSDKPLGSNGIYTNFSKSNSIGKGKGKGKGKELEVLKEGEGEEGRKIWETPLIGVTLYVTVEPCVMCAAAMRQIGIDRCVYGCANDKFGGCGGVQSIHDDPRLMYSSTYIAEGGYRREDAIMLLRRFYISSNHNAPNPKDKSKRVLRTDFLPIPETSTPPREKPAFEWPV